MLPSLGRFYLIFIISFLASLPLYADQNAIVIVPLADVWNRPAVDSSTLTPDLRETQLLLGEKVVIHSSSGAWVRLETPDQPEFTHDHRWEGYPGWVLSQDVLVLTHDLGTKAAILDVAESLMGTPYLWGGLGKAGIDCSGLVHLSYRLNGIDVPRDAHEQWMKAKKLKRPQLKPGDLIFSEKTIHPGTITHVAFYLGEGQILEAPQLGLRVRTISFADKYGKPVDQVESGDTVGERVIFYGRLP